MSYTTLPKSGLRLTEPTSGDTDWVEHYNYNMLRLNDTNLYLHHLLDFDIAGLADGIVLRWDSITSKWKCWKPNKGPV